jgi:S1-C subfamily serine protease
MRGWISPDDRLWRHPSESGRPAIGSSAIDSGPVRPTNRARSGPWIVGGTTACLVLALIATGLVVATTGAGDQEVSGSAPASTSLVAAPTTEPGVKQAVGSSALGQMVSSARPSTVVLRIARSSGTSTTTGLVVESGGIIVAMAEAVSGAKRITVIEPGGSHQVAEVIGVDQSSGLAVVRIGDDLPAATFDSNDPSSGGGAIAMALEPAKGADTSPSPVVYAGTVLSAGQTVDADQVTSTFVATAVVAPLSRDDLGCPLLDSAGHVSGLLEKTVQDGPSTISVFLPAELVLGVAQQLVTSGAVVHGWLGVHTSDAYSVTTTAANSGAAAPPPTGARLDSVDTGSPAAGALAAGDIITGIGGFRVQSSAELQTRLYPDRPGTSLEVAFTRGGAPMTTLVMLASRDTDAQGARPSP